MSNIDKRATELLIENGYEVKVITHPHFGPDPVKVFAIKVNINA